MAVAVTARTETTERDVSWQIIATVMLSTLLNPLNSSMMSVALLGAATDLRVDIPTATWLVSSFFLVGAATLPLAGHIADLYGPRRVIGAGLLIVLGASIGAALAPEFGWLLAARVLQALGSAVAMPAGLAILRVHASSPRPPARALGAIAMANSISAAIGPAIGGFLVNFGGWQAIFWINAPLSLLGLLMVWRWLPAGDRQMSKTQAISFSALLQQLDLPGIGLFAAAVSGFLAFLMSLSSGPTWVLLVLAAVGGVLFVNRELREAVPFLDVRFLASQRRLVSVYLEFAAVSLVFYAAFFGLPLWLQHSRHFDVGRVGVIILPITAVGVVLTPLATRMIARGGVRFMLILGAVALVAGSALQFVFDDSTPVALLLLTSGVIGVAYSFNNLGLQAELYVHAPPEMMGAASGQFITFRYIGATLCTAVLGLVFHGAATNNGLHMLAMVLTLVAALLLVASLRRTPTASPGAAADR